MWMEAFAIFSAVLATHFPYCWKDLCQYQLLILHTYQQFGSHNWLAYDRASCENAVATNLVDSSEINMQLFNFHAAGTCEQQDSWSRTFEPFCSSHSTITCRSWDRGCCSAPNVNCYFAHHCWSCSRSDRAIHCSGMTAAFPWETTKGRSSPPPPATLLHAASRSWSGLNCSI